MLAGLSRIALTPAGDERQALRLRRFLMAAGTSLMVIVLLVVAYLFDGLERTGLVQGTALILFWVGVFYIVIRSGLNLKLPDPSLTMPQLTSSILSMAYIMYYADRGRGALLIVYLVSFLFGVFRLRSGNCCCWRDRDSRLQRDGDRVVCVQAGDRRAGGRNPPVDGARGDAAVVRVDGRLCHAGCAKT